MVIENLGPATAWNTIELTCSGSSISVKVNGLLVLSAQDGNYQSAGYSWFGVVHDSPEASFEARFDNLKLRLLQ